VSDVTCPGEQEVEDFLAHRLADDAATRFELHVDACAACRELVSALAGDGSEQRRLAPGDKLGRFVIGSVLGAGGMGVVYAARDPALERKVAVKVLRDAAAGARLVREGQALAQLAHPNVVAVHDIGEDAGRPYIAMELVDGATLGAWLRAAERSRGEVLEVLVQVARGLAAAHAAGIVHRDVKPDNVLVDRAGRARVTDFGLVDVAASALAGTPAYMAPEQIDGAGVDARADQFAFCVLAVEALRGKRPFAGDTLAELRAAIARGPELGDVPRRLRRPLARGLAEAPADRFASMDALLAVLARPHRTAWAVTTAAVVAPVIVIWFARGRPAACPDPAERLAGVWDAPVQAAIERAFSATGAPFAADAWRGVYGTLEQHAQAWTALQRATCDAHDKLAPDQLDRRTACLARRADELRALTGVLSHADRATVERAVGATGALASVDDCATTGAIALPADPARRAQATALERAIAAAQARWTAGALAPATAQLERIVREARALGEPSVLATALLALGRVRRDTTADAGRATLREAAQIAERAGLDALKADALIAIVSASADAAYDGGSALADALSAERDARATLARVGGDPLRSSHLQNALCDVLLSAGKSQDALACATRAARLAPPEEAHTPEIMLGSALHDLGRLAEAYEHDARALALLEARFGPRHPNVAVALHDRGIVLQEQEKLADAKADFERALAILEAAYGPDAAPVGQTLTTLGNTLEYLGDHAGALRDLTRARAIYQRVRGAENPEILDGLGRVERALGHFDAALALHRQALDQRLAELGPDDTEIALSHMNLGQLEQARGRPADAIAHFREALRIHERAFGAGSSFVEQDKKLIAGVKP
jgi:eukaryotic-like serine/threonine-protein kinase